MAAKLVCFIFKTKYFYLFNTTYPSVLILDGRDFKPITLCISNASLPLKQTNNLSFFSVSAFEKEFPRRDTKRLGLDPHSTSNLRLATKISARKHKSQGRRSICSAGMLPEPVFTRLPRFCCGRFETGMCRALIPNHFSE